MTKIRLRSKGKKKTYLFKCAHRYIDVFMRKEGGVPQGLCCLLSPLINCLGVRELAHPYVSANSIL